MALIGILICIMFSAYFSATEIAFASAKKHRIDNRAEQGDRRAVLAKNIADNFGEALSSILIGNNLVNIAASSISTVLILDLVGSSGTVISTAIMTVVILIFGEISPKIIAKQSADKFVLISARPLTLIMKVLKPLNAIVMFLLEQFNRIVPMPQEADTVSEEHLSTIIEAVEDEGIIDEGATSLLLSALDFPDISVSEIVTPRVEIEAVDLADDMEEIIGVIFGSIYSRLPVYEGHIDNIKGILHVANFLKVLSENKDLTKEEFKALLYKDICVNETMKLPKVFSILNQGKMQMAIVKDEYGGTVGCVTLEDLLEEIVGEIWDESDVIERDVRELAHNSYDVLASVSLRDFAEEVDVEYDLFDSDYNTVGGFLLEEFGRFPAEGEVLEFQNMRFTIVEADAIRIIRVHVDIEEIPEDDDLLS